MRNALFLAFGVVFLFLAPVNEAKAQTEIQYTCGMRCETLCYIPGGEWGMAGVDGTSNPLAAHFWMGCQAGSQCAACGASRRGGESEALAAALASASPEAAGKLARANRNRILVSLTRNVIVIRGTECNPDAFVAVASVNNARAKELARLGIARLESVSPAAAAKSAN
jgi:hypothetical protein